jgi:hypothetical protein
MATRRTMPCTTYPLDESSSVRYEPSWPVIPVMSALLGVDIVPYQSALSRLLRRFVQTFAKHFFR